MTFRCSGPLPRLGWASSPPPQSWIALCCCYSSNNKHVTKHFRKTRHPIIRSLEPGEDWCWRYVDEMTLEPSR